MSNQDAGYEQQYQEMMQYENQLQAEQNHADSEVKENEKMKGTYDQQNTYQNMKKTQKSIKEIMENYQREDTASDENPSQEGDLINLKKLELEYKRIMRETDQVKAKLKKIKDIRANEFKANINLIQEINKLKSKLKEKEDYISNLTYQKEKMKEEINDNKKDWYDVLTQQKILKKLEQHSEELKQEIKKIKNIDNGTDREQYMISAYKAMIERKAEGTKLTSGESRDKYRINNNITNSILQAEELVKFNNLKQEIRIFQNLFEKQNNTYFKTVENLKKTLSHYLVSIKQNQERIKQIYKNAKSLSNSSRTLSTRLFKIQSTKNLLNNYVNATKSNNIYIGNKLLLDKSIHKEDNFELSLSGKKSLFQIVFFSRIGQTNEIIFQCRYTQNTFGLVHNSREYLDCSQNEIHIHCEDLEEIQIYYSYKIEGLGIKMKKNQLFVLIGENNENSQMESIGFTDKKFIGLGSYWFKNQLVGLNFRYVSTSKSANIKNKRKQQRLLVRQQYFN